MAPLAQTNDMNTPKPNGLAELLNVVDQFRDTRRDQILLDAQTQAHDSIRQAYRKARARLHVSIMEEREHGFHELISAEAQLQTQQRQLRQQDDMALLQRVWPLLEQTLAARWRDAAQRALWIDQIITDALRVLPAAPWRVEHAVDWPADEQQTLAASIQQHTGHAPQFIPIKDIVAGLRINVESATLDGTVQGLLVNRSQIEALLLAHCHTAQGGTGQCATP